MIESIKNAVIFLLESICGWWLDVLYAFLSWAITACIELLNWLEVTSLPIDREDVIALAVEWGSVAERYVPVSVALTLCGIWLALRGTLTIIRIILHIIP